MKLTIVVEEIGDPVTIYVEKKGSAHETEKSHFNNIYSLKFKQIAQGRVRIFNQKTLN